jgi:hypothetical protein
MPLILAPSDYVRWLSDDDPFPGRTDADVADLDVNKPENDAPSIIEIE